MPSKLTVSPTESITPRTNPRALRGGAWANYGTDWFRPSHCIEIETVYSKPSVGFRTILNAQHTRESY